MKRYSFFLLMMILAAVMPLRSQVIQTSSWSDFYSTNTQLNLAPVPIGAVIDAYDPQGVHCGTFTVTTAGSYGFLHVYGDDPLTAGVDEGAVPGDTITFTINGAPTTASAAAVWQAGTPGAIVMVNLSSVPSSNITASAGPHGTITPSGVIPIPYGTNQTFSILPASGYGIDSLIIDGVVHPDTINYTFTNVTANHSISVSFVLLASYATRYRSFPYESLVVAKPVKKKNVHQYWEFNIVNTTGSAIAELHCVFAGDVSAILSSGSFSSAGSKKTWSFNGILAAGDSVLITGRSAKAKPQSLAKLWLGPLTKTPTAVKVPANKNVSELPMPNAASIREDAYKRYLSSVGGMTVGIARIDSPKAYGWVQMKKAGDMYKSFFDKKTGYHTHTNHGFLTFSGGKPFVKKVGSLPPSKQDNRTFADLTALKLGIVLSDLGTTQRGFGELLYTESGSPFAGMLLRDIAITGDTMMTFASQPRYASHPELYAALDTALMHINAAFAGPIDTVSWGDTLKIAGTTRIVDTGILTPSGVAPAVIVPHIVEPESEANVPEEFHLEQNYPNPFNPTTTIRFSLPVASTITLKVYSMIGQEIVALVDGESMDAGMHVVNFNAEGLASGVYFYRLTARPDEAFGEPIFTDVGKMLLLR